LFRLFAAAALAAGVFAGPAQAEDEAQVAQDSAAVLAALTTGSDALPLPESKQQTMAALSVPELAPQVKKQVLPQYPSLARQARIQGVVYARILVNEHGRVAQVGRIQGQAIFRKAVEQAARQWEFTPAQQGDRPVKAWVNVPFSFEL
jgi:protein TonB